MIWLFKIESNSASMYTTNASSPPYRTTSESEPSADKNITMMTIHILIILKLKIFLFIFIHRMNGKIREIWFLIFFFIIFNDSTMTEWNKNIKILSLIDIIDGRYRFPFKIYELRVFRLRGWLMECVLPPLLTRLPAAQDGFKSERAQSVESWLHGITFNRDFMRRRVKRRVVKARKC